MTGSTPREASLNRFADALAEAEVNARPIPPLSADHPTLSVADAYAIQQLGREARERRGHRLVGRKVGLTSAAMREMLGVEEPDFGYLTDDLVCHSGARLPRAALIAPMVEPEIAFRLDRAVAGPDVTAADVLAATDAVAPALEVIDSRITDWRITLVDTVADNASCARAVLGSFRPLDELDLALVAVEQRLMPLRDQRVETVRGDGSAVLGHPAEAVAWLARALDRYAATALDAGEVVLPGAMTRALPVAAGDRVEAVFSDLGSVTVSIAGPED